MVSIVVLNQSGDLIRRLEHPNLLKSPERFLRFHKGSVLC
jgi:hypothetical protein